MITSLKTSLLQQSATSRGLCWLLFAVAELTFICLLFEFKPYIKTYAADYFLTIFISRLAIRTGLASLALFALLTWSERHRLAKDWRDAIVRADVTFAIAVNFGFLALFAVGAIAYNAQVASNTVQPWLSVAIAVLFAATFCSLVNILVRGRDVLKFVWNWRVPLTKSIALATIVIGISDFSQLIWQYFAGATLHASAILLGLVEPAVVVDSVAREITVGDFTAVISDTCSGIQGLALVAAFVTAYLWIFCDRLRMPQALWLYPIGLVASWLLNAVRIAVLTWIGAHVSPEVAINGFHSQAGWIAFLLVSLGLMLLSLKFVEQRNSARVSAVIRLDDTTAYLLPFAALMLGTILTAAMAPYHHPAYVLKAMLVTASLCIGWRAYSFLLPKFSPIAIGSGIVVGAAWIATQSPSASAIQLESWLANVEPEVASTWLLLRGIGTIVLVPIAEELAFRGYLYRRLIARDVFAVDPKTLSWIALLVSSLLFGLLHDRWLAGALAGGVFAIVMVRSGRLSDAVVSHATANAVIFMWALAMREWSLL